MLRQTARHSRVWESKNVVGLRGMTALQGVVEGMSIQDKRHKELLVQVLTSVPVGGRTGTSLQLDERHSVVSTDLVGGTFLMTQVCAELEFRGRNPCRK